MRLPPGGIDIYYIDESMKGNVFALSAGSIPFLRSVEGTWTLVWEDQLENVKQWRKQASHDFGIPVSKELKGSKLLSGRGRFFRGRHQIGRTRAFHVYRQLLERLTFLQGRSIITVVGYRNPQLYGHTKLEAVLYALLQRMRTACERTERAGMVFFDEGHGEYVKLYRKARVYLPTGSSLGGWGSGSMSQNMPLNNFTKDGNLKDSKMSHFIQVADLVAYAAFLKVRAGLGQLTGWQTSLGAGSLYDAIPTNALNAAASRSDPQGIVRL